MHGTRNIYYNMATARLRELRSKKAVQLQKYDGQHHTYFTQQEARQLRQQIVWIDAVLEAREAQPELL